MILLLAILFFIPLDSYAYLDPGTGAMVIQAIVAAFAGLVFYAKKIGKKIQGFLNKESGEKSNESSTDVRRENR